VFAAGAPFNFSSLDRSTTAALTDISVQRWSSSPKLRAVPPAGSRARSDGRSVHAAPHVSRKFCVDHLRIVFARSSP